MNSLTPSQATGEASISAVPMSGGLPWRPLMAGLTCLLACGLASQGGALSVVASSAGALATAWWARGGGRGGPTRSSPLATAADSAPLAQAVVPAWKAQLELTRQQAEGAVEDMLGHFAQLAGHLQSASSPDHDMPEDSRDFVEGVLAQSDAQLQALSEPLSHAIATRRETRSAILDFSQSLDDLRKLAREVQTVARSTNLVAVNAAIEANRAGTEGHSFAIVADEVRRLAAQSGSTGDQIAARIATIDRAMEALQARVGSDLESDEATMLAARHTARRVVMKVLESAAQMADSSRAMRDLNRDVQRQIEELMVGLQHQDRFSQMLASISTDMERFETWLGTGEMSSASHASEWLERLARSYTTQEQRHEHHGTTAVHTSGGVDFF